MFVLCEGGVVHGAVGLNTTGDLSKSSAKGTLCADETVVRSQKPLMSEGNVLTGFQRLANLVVREGTYGIVSSERN